jgi:hypothetical protein
MDLVSSFNCSDFSSAEKSGSAVDGDEDDDFLPESQHKKQKKQKGNSLPEKLRADLYTLKENHDHLLSAPFDASFNENGGLDLSSSQIDGGLGFDDNIFGVSDAFDISGGLGDDLARELGEGWGTPSKDRNEYRITLFYLSGSNLMLRTLPDPSWTWISPIIRSLVKLEKKWTLSLTWVSMRAMKLTCLLIFQ